MKRKDSLYGVHCWFCGHPAWGQTALKDSVNRACEECKRAPKGAETADARKAELREWRAADLADGAQHPQYWSFRDWEEIRKLPASMREKLMPIPYEFTGEAAATKQRMREQKLAYNKQYNDRRKNGIP